MDTLEKLVALSRELGREDRNWAILGEGNTSTLASEYSYYVKASGSCLATANRDDFTEVNLDLALEHINRTSLTDEEILVALESIKVDKNSKLPSVETFVHAVCLSEGDCRWVGHGHPESVLAILCSKLGAKAYSKHIFPDAIVVCGRSFAVVPYVDPGFKLAHAVRNSIRRFKKLHNKSPKVILLENHGPFILGQSDLDIINTMMMLNKWSKILIANQAFGGAQYLSNSDSDRIENRLDEAYRRKRLLDNKQ